MDEFALIARYFAPLDGAGAADIVLGIGDDGAVLAPAAGRLVVVVDTLVSGVHFPPDLPAADIGYRAAAVNLSDIAAMGARPRYATLALTLPQADEAWLAGFAAGLAEALGAADVALVGGDTTRGPLTVTVQVIGIATGPVLTRGGAQAGDIVAVSGSPGDAAAGLGLLGPATQDAHVAWLRARFTRPQPRLALGAALAPFAHAAIDVSDGLLADLGHIAAASGLGAEVDLEALPLSAALRAVAGLAAAREHALGGGDDYELLFTLAPADWPRATAAAAAAGVVVTAIGRMTATPGVRCLDAAGAPWRPARSGYRHFT